MKELSFKELLRAFKLRSKNIFFWIGILGLLLSVLGLKIEDLTNWNILIIAFKNFLSNPFLVISFIGGLMGIIVNPTTKGITDKN